MSATDEAAGPFRVIPSPTRGGRYTVTRADGTAAFEYGFESITVAQAVARELYRAWNDGRHDEAAAKIIERQKTEGVVYRHNKSRERMVEIGRSASLVILAPTFGGEVRAVPIGPAFTNNYTPVEPAIFERA